MTRGTIALLAAGGIGLAALAWYLRRVRDPALQDAALVPRGVLENLDKYPAGFFSPYLTGPYCIDAAHAYCQTRGGATRLPLKSLYASWRVAGGSVEPGSPDYQQAMQDQGGSYYLPGAGQTSDLGKWTSGGGASKVWVAPWLAVDPVTPDPPHLSHTTSGFKLGFAGAPFVHQGDNWKLFWPWATGIGDDRPPQDVEPPVRTEDLHFVLDAADLGLCAFPPAEFENAAQAELWVRVWQTWISSSVYKNRAAAWTAVQFARPELAAKVREVIAWWGPSPYDPLPGGNPLTTSYGQEVMHTVPAPGTSAWDVFLRPSVATPKGVAACLYLQAVTMAVLKLPGMELVPGLPTIQTPSGGLWDGVGTFIKTQGPGILSSMAGGVAGTGKGIAAAAITQAAKVVKELTASVKGMKLPWSDSWEPVAVPRSVLGLAAPAKQEQVSAQLAEELATEASRGLLSTHGVGFLKLAVKP